MNLLCFENISLERLKKVLNNTNYGKNMFKYDSKE